MIWFLESLYWKCRRQKSKEEKTRQKEIIWKALKTRREMRRANLSSKDGERR